MPDTLSIATNGLNAIASRVASTTNVIVNASSTNRTSASDSSSASSTGGAVGGLSAGGTAAAIINSSTSSSDTTLASALVSIQSDTIQYDATAAVIKVAKNNDNTLINMTA